MPAQHLLTERRGAVGVITLNRPELRNAFDDALASENLDAEIGRILEHLVQGGPAAIASFLDKRKPRWFPGEL